MALQVQKQNKPRKWKYSFIRMTPRFKSHIISKFHAMEEFKYFTISAIEDEKKSIEKRFANDTDGMTEEEVREYFDWNGEDYFMVEDVFQKISMDSFIIILYSYIESGLNSLCRVRYSDARMEEQKKKNKQAGDEGKEPLRLFEITYKDMTGKGIKRARKYLAKVCGVSFDSVKKQWDEINALAKLRNAIVHDSSLAKEQIEKDGKINQHVRNGRIEITDHGENTYGRIVIKREYLDAIFPVAVDFFRKLEV